MKFNPRAFFYHFLVSIVFISLFALLILIVWYPGIWSRVLGGYDLFIKILIIDLFVGPICLGFVYKYHKSKLEKTIDVSVIAFFQLAFLVYGLWVLSVSRPAFIVFATDGYYAYVANEINPELLSDVSPFNRISLSGPVYAGVDFDKIDSGEIVDLIFMGADVTSAPKYFKEIETVRPLILKYRHPYLDLPESDLKFALAKYIKKHKLDESDVYWLPARHRSVSNEIGYGMITGILVKDEIIPREYVNIDSYDLIDAYEKEIIESDELEGYKVNKDDSMELNQEITKIIDEAEQGSVEDSSKISDEIDLRLEKETVENETREE